MDVVQGGNNEIEWPMPTPIQEIIADDEERDADVDNFEVNFPKSPSPPASPTKRPVVPRMITSYEPKTRSSGVDSFLRVLKTKKASSLSEKSATQSFVRKKRQEQLNLFDSEEVPEVYCQTQF